MQRVRHHLLDFFPPPKILLMPSIGIDLSDHYVRAIKIDRTPKGVIVSDFAEFPIPEGVVDGGFVNKPEELTKVLLEVKKRFKVSFVKATLPEEKSYLFTTRLPHLEPSEIRGAVEFKIQENVPVQTAQSVFEYSVLKSSTADHIDVCVTVVPEGVVATYTNAFTAAGLTPLSFFVESQAVARSVIPTGDATTTLIVNVAESKTGFYVVRNGIVQFSSTLKTGSESIHAIAEKRFKVSADEARAMKKQGGGKGMSDDSEFVESLGILHGAINGEVRKIYNYWQSYTGKEEGKEEKIARIITVGEDTVLLGIQEAIGKVFPIHIEGGKVWSNVFSLETYVPPIDFVESLNYAGAIGCALHSYA